LPYLLAAVWVFCLWRASQAERIVYRAFLPWLLLFTSLTVLAFTLYPLKGFEEIFPIDDSYISLTAARNIAEHNLPAVNPAAPLAGITSPLHVLTMGLLGKLVGVPNAARIIGCFFFLALIAGVYCWTKALQDDELTPFFASAMVALGGLMAAHSLNGLETAPFSALLIWSFVLFEWSRTKPALIFALGLVVGMTILTRPEGWFVAFALYAVAMIDGFGKRRNLRQVIYSGLLALLVVSPYLAMNYHYNHALFPLTVSAKKHFFGDYCLSWMDRLHVLRLALPILPGSFIFLLPLLLWAKPFFQRVYPWLFMLIFYVAYLSQFVGALLHYGGRYQHPLLPLLLVALTIGGRRFIAWLAQRSQPSLASLARPALLCLMAVFLFMAAFNGALHRALFRMNLENTRNPMLATVQWVKDHTAPGDLVATHDVGVLYYFGRRQVLDLVGLTDPEVAHIHVVLTDSCRDRAVRMSSLYSLLETRQPKIIYFMDKWDKQYMGLRLNDNDKHLQLRHRQRIANTGIVYHFYEGNWNAENNRADILAQH